jgi:phosphoribosylformylglycinamidine synthase
MVQLTRGRLRKDAVLFGESQSRAVISAKPAHRQKILEQARQCGVSAEVVGSVTGDRLVIQLKDAGAAETVIDQPLATLYDRWACSLERAVNQT